MILMTAKESREENGGPRWSCWESQCSTFLCFETHTKKPEEERNENHTSILIKRFFGFSFFVCSPPRGFSRVRLTVVACTAGWLWLIRWNLFGLIFRAASKVNPFGLLFILIFHARFISISRTGPFVILRPCVFPRQNKQIFQTEPKKVNLPCCHQSRLLYLFNCRTSLRMLLRLHTDKLLASFDKNRKHRATAQASPP